MRSAAARLLSTHLPRVETIRLIDRPLRWRSPGLDDVRGVVLAASTGVLDNAGNVVPTFPIPVARPGTPPPRWAVVLQRNRSTERPLTLWTRLQGDMAAWAFEDREPISLADLDRYGDAFRLDLATHTLDGLRDVLRRAAEDALDRARRIQDARDTLDDTWRSAT